MRELAADFRSHTFNKKLLLESFTLVPKHIHIKKNVWLGAAVTILPGVTIGENAEVAAGV
jgi:acetyltransferase-like isoleucine patch superfamily enzyme